ncbi:MAG: MBL fold metallo-hydrolase [Pseudomonadota bacterium]
MVTPKRRALGCAVINVGAAALAAAAVTSPTVAAHPDTDEETVQYLANEGIMVTHGAVKVLFDPLFNKGFGQYQLLPPAIKEKLVAGLPPYDDVDVVFVSHSHDDHFAVDEMAAYLASNDAILVGPAQVISALSARESAVSFDGHGRMLQATFGPGTACAPSDTEVCTFAIERGGLAINVEAVRIPHAGGLRRAQIENMVYRVTLDDALTVMHLGDATPDQSAFTPHTDHWKRLLSHAAFPPEWIIRVHGREGTETLLNADHVIGVHVPVFVPAALIATGADYFSQPGETRSIPHHHNHKEDRP